MYKLGFTSYSFNFFLQKNLLCNVHVSIVQNILLDAIVILYKPFVHIYLNFRLKWAKQMCVKNRNVIMHKLQVVDLISLELISCIL